MLYKVGEREFALDFKSLEYSYQSFTIMSDEEFMENIIDVLHYACYVCWLKNIPTKECLSDDGIIHELIHLAKNTTKQHVDLQLLRKRIKLDLHINKNKINLVEN